jgi:hypothetical protein
MKSLMSILILAALALGQLPGKSQPQQRRMPILGFAESKDATPIMDTDVFDEQKYAEEAGSDSVSLKTKRAAHEAALAREFMDGFNQAKECDSIILQGKGDQKPDFALQVMVDSHDTPGQKPVWTWILRDVRHDQLMPVGNDDSGPEAARSICLAVWKDASPDQFKNKAAAAGGY